jgi:acetylornithine deacetylase/succinyl-diaminopimelate desuccinylase-like protein
MQTSLEATLTKLIAIPSVTENAVACFEAVNFVKKQLAPLDLYITESAPTTERPWLYATTQPTLEPDILLAAHLDVVPAPEHLFTLRREDGKLFGRGVYDMKLAVACYLEFLKQHAKSLDSLNIGVLFTSDEEIGGDCLPDILATGLRPKTVFIPDGGGDWHIEGRAKGFFGLEIRANGKSAHGSRPWEGDNALHRIIDITQILRNEHPHNDPNGTTLSITAINGGAAVNQIADTASALIDFRTFDAQELANFELRLFDLAAQHNVTATINQSGRPVIFDKYHPAVQSFMRTFEAMRGKPAEYVESYGGSDARYFAEYNIPCIIVEPNGGGRHAEDEWLLATDLEAYYRLIETWLLADKPPVTHARQTNGSTLTITGQ